jgi:hypothetical protein
VVRIESNKQRVEEVNWIGGRYIFFGKVLLGVRRLGAWRGEDNSTNVMRRGNARGAAPFIGWV